MESFEYAPLDSSKSEIRLLELLPGEERTLRCNLLHASLDHSLTYEALSYTWGNPELVDCIEVKGRTHWIPESLNTALSFLRLPTEGRVLWIDAVCINQNDKQEQGQQVRQMSKIYERADRVIFWLGKATADVNMFMDSLAELQEKGMKLACDAEDALDKRWQDCWATMSFQGQDSLLLRLRAGLLSILRRPWFRRMWILQEVAKARSALVCLGSKAAPAHLLVIAPIVLNVTPEPHCQSVLEIFPGSRTSQSVSWWTGQRNLYTLSRKFRASEATDERDRVFALLGISSDSRDLQRVVPDYRQSTKDIVENFVDHLISTYQAKVSEVLELLTTFKTLYGLYATRAERMLDVYQSSLGTPSYVTKTLDLSDTVQTELEATKGSALLVLEDHNNSKDGGTVQAEVLTLSHYSASSVVQTLQPGNVKLLLLKDAQQVFEVICTHGCRILFQKLFEDRAVFGWQSQTFESVLADAAKSQDTYILEQLLERGADVNGEAGRKALLNAVGKSHIKAAQLLLQYGVSLTGVSDGSLNFDPLREAASIGSLPIVQLLHLKGSDPNNYSALREASQAGHLSIVRYLIEQGASVDAPPPASSSTDSTSALLAAVRNTHVDVIQLLLDHGADTHTAIHPAFEIGDETIIKMVLRRTDRSGLETANPFRYHPIHVASADGRSDIVQLLLDRGVDVNVLSDESSSGPQTTALVKAAWYGHEDTVELLLRHGADVNKCNSLGDTPLVETSERGHLGVVRILLSHGAHLRRVGGHRTPLQAACSISRVEILKLLLKLGADVEEPARDGETVLHFALGNEEIFRIILEAGANINAARKDGETPLHIVCGYAPRMSITFNPDAQLRTLRTLLERGANIHAKWGRSGLRPVDVAITSSYSWPSEHAQILLQLLFDHGATVSDYNRENLLSRHPELRVPPPIP